MSLLFEEKKYLLSEPFAAFQQSKQRTIGQHILSLDSRQIGTVALPSGRLAVFDPALHARTFIDGIEPGSYPLLLATALDEHPELGEFVAYAALCVRDTLPVRWVDHGQRISIVSDVLYCCDVAREGQPLTVSLRDEELWRMDEGATLLSACTEQVALHNGYDAQGHLACVLFDLNMLY
uniref:Uncharacterized protein n=1 Tax=Thermosporothrix sp. COM3 TaxID=2490863 RepID=A0A455SB13_9CHLR|nr:hypothetical protein KTC_04040 [Thermosporothrix sp. COM3]